MAPMVETVQKVFIKPSSPTPQSLSYYNLSSLDQLMPLTYISAAFFYDNPSHESLIIRQQIQNSLSKTLVSYYPFAGSLIENDHIHCNDKGVEFVEVRICCSINDILKHARSHAKNLALPFREVPRNENTLAVVQLSHFDCGGVAIACGISHKVGDASTLISFMKDWATSTCLSSHVPSPLLVADSVFPHGDDVLCEPYVPSQNCVMRRFIFPSSEIEKLKSKAVESGIYRPTRVEVVTALLYQFAMAATTSINRGSSRPSVLLQPMNIRSFFALPQNSVGNIFSFNFCVNEDDQKDFSALVGQLKEAKLTKNLSREKITYESQMQEFELSLKQHNISSFDTYRSSSWCGFPFYDVDFGWGKPTWVCTFEPKIKDTVVLIDSPEGGVEALVILEEEKMSAFEKNEKLLPFASLDSAKVEVDPALVIQ